MIEETSFKLFMASLFSRFGICEQVFQRLRLSLPSRSRQFQTRSIGQTKLTLNEEGQ
jgi:hypothetical protein